MARNQTPPAFDLDAMHAHAGEATRLLKALANEMGRFRNAEVVWCQEEPKNMGAWSFVEPYLEWVLGQANCAVKRARYVGRPASASIRLRSSVPKAWPTTAASASRM